MTIGSARGITAGSVLTADVCIVGGGAAGITLARQLDGLGLDVVLLEAGRLRPQVEVAGGRDVELLGLPWPNPEPSRGFGFGGSTRYWFGRIAMPDAIDLDVRDWVPFSGWPVGLAELRPWTEVAAQILAVPNFERIDIGTWPSNATIETFRQRDGADLDVFLWSRASDMGPHHRQMMERSSTVRVLLDAMAVDLVATERSDSIAALRVAGPDGARFTVEARRFVLASGGLENARLLLASTSRSAAGVGNDHDLVGRFYMDHPRGEGLATADLSGVGQDVIDRIAFLGERTRSASGRVQFCVTFSEQLQRREHLLNHALHAHLVSPLHDAAAARSVRLLLSRKDSGTTFLDNARSVVKGSPELLGLAVRKASGRMRASRAVFIDQMEQEPDPDSRITVDPRVVDRWGMPQLQVDWRVARSTYESQRRMHEMVRGIMARAGISDFRSTVLDGPDEEPVVWDMKHPSGTTRMSSSPLQGVVDADCRVHGMDNLYVVGSSVFPTVGHFNPTLVIVALAARLAAHLATARRG